MFGTLLNTMRKGGMLPKISDTERQALDAGHVWIDGDFFGGNPDFKHMLAEAYNDLPAEEQAFMDGPVEELLRMIKPYEISQSRRIPDTVMAFMKREGFFGLIIPKEYGGKGFSALGRSSVMAKVGAVSGVLSPLVVIPNSIGAAELIEMNGTEEQKRHYLPKLAAGEMMPCFGLTEPTAGSDAASIKAEGVVFKDEDGELKLRMNFRKRYITLAPIANLISLACRVHDPDNLLGKGTAPGITVVLLEKGTPGLENGDHHEPIGEPFYNGPIIGTDVVASLDNVIGGRSAVGEGWRMLMEGLAGGRAISLPAGAIGGAKAVALMTGAYSVVRQQFGIDIGQMEGVQAKIGHIAGLTYMLEGSRVYSCSALDRGIAPPVVSAALKYSTTQLSRDVITDAMDVFAGRGVMQGPSNVVGPGYCTAPVGITVEGANIMTRTLITFGQGATRCHPYAMNTVAAVENNDVSAFRKNLLGWMGHFALNIGRAFTRFLTRGYSAGSPVSGPTATYYRRLGWASTRFSVLTNLAMFLMGSKLKAKGNLTGRYADVLTWLTLGFSALRRYEAEGRKAEDLVLVEYSLEYALAQIQQAFEGIYANFEAPVLGAYLRTVGSFLLRVNPLSRGPADKVTVACAATLQSMSEQQARITRETFLAGSDVAGAGRLLHAFKLICEAQPAAAKIAKAMKAKQLPRAAIEDSIEAALQAQVISGAEADQLKAAHEARMETIEVDVFKPEDFFRDTVPSAELQREAA
jgi:acyl-CoA dehydrogenase